MEPILQMTGQIAGLVILDIVLLVSLLVVPLGLPGNFVIVGAALIAGFATRFVPIGWIDIAAMLGLAVIGEVVEGFLGSAMAGRYGASKWGMVGAFGGGLIGAVLGTAAMPVLGTLIGSFIGTAGGAILVEWALGATTSDGARAGFGALLGRSLSTLFKLSIGMAMAIYVMIRVH